jgi:SAM-dependent methyltransferase
LLLDRVGPDGHVHGVDVSQTMLDSATRRFSAEISAGRLALHAGTMVNLPLPTDALDAAVTVNTIYFVDDLPLAFSELARVLRPGGRAVVGLGDPEEMARIPFTAHGFRLRDAADVVDLLGNAGFDVEHVRVGDDPGAFHLLVGTRRAASG